jgi:ABC-type multidrug transport system fused ATPase/permease subunit
MSWFQTHPDGLNTKLKPVGAAFRREAQLLALPRVFLKDPDWLSR